MEIILILRKGIILKVLHNKKITVTITISIKITTIILIRIIIIRLTTLINKKVILANLIPRNKRYIIPKIVLILMIVLVGI